MKDDMDANDRVTFLCGAFIIAFVVFVAVDGTWVLPTASADACDRWAAHDQAAICADPKRTPTPAESPK